MLIKLTEITKGDAINAVGNINFIYDIVDDKGVLLGSSTSTISVNYDNIDIVQLAIDLIADAESKIYEIGQKVKVDKFDLIVLQSEIEKQISAKVVIP